jgi:hypothetical protein
MNSKTIIQEFISAVNNRNAVAARRWLSPDAELRFPGDALFGDIEELLRWASTRYREAFYRYDSFEELSLPDREIVYARGRISGELNDGEAFSNVRVIDRFEISEGRIVSKEAWSDIADFLRKKDASRTPTTGGK